MAIQFRLEQGEVAIEHAIPMGLIVNEAETNSLEHAVPDGRAGTIEVVWQQQQGKGSVLSIYDDGKGAEEAVVHGSGLRLMAQLADQIGGEMNIGTSPNAGTGVTIKLPVRG